MRPQTLLWMAICLWIAPVPSGWVRTVVAAESITFATPGDVNRYLRWRPGRRAFVTAIGGGVNVKYPMNCLENFQHALDEGADFIEISTARTKDGVHVVMDWQTSTDAPVEKLRARDCTLQELKQLNLKTGNGTIRQLRRNLAPARVTACKIPTLEETIAWARGKTLLFAAVPEGDYNEVLAFVDRLKAWNVCIPMAGTAAAAASIHARWPEANIMCMCMDSDEKLPDDRIVGADPKDFWLSTETTAKLHKVGVLVPQGAYGGGNDIGAVLNGPHVYYMILERGGDIIRTECVALAAEGARDFHRDSVFTRECGRIFEEVVGDYRKGKPGAVAEVREAIRARFEARLDSLGELDRAGIQALRERVLVSLANVRGIPFTAKAPIVDGTVNDVEWHGAARLQGLWLYQANRRPRHGTTVYMCHDTANLYVGAVLEEETGGRVIANVKDRDGCIWKDDSIEVAIQPEFDGAKNIYHVIVNPQAVCFDRRNTDATWNGNIRMAARHGVGDNAWSVELAIPFAGLGMKGAAGEMFRGNIGRNNIGVDANGKETTEFSSWAPTMAGLCDRHSFGVFVLEAE